MSKIDSAATTLEATALVTKPRRPAKLRLVGFAALGACGIGYAGFLTVIIALKAEAISTAAAIAAGGVFAVVGEAGLWVGAACLGLGLYTRRKEKIARFVSAIQRGFKR